MPPADRGDLVFVGDVHLDRADPDLAAFVDYLRGLAPRAGRIVLMGDLFNLWIGGGGLEQAHHAVVTACLRELRAGGTEVHYLEGNRDYRVGRAHRGSAFDAVDATGLREDWAGLKIWAAHGDLVNARDLQYRSWRRISRSAPVWWLFSSIPRPRRFALAESLERRMRGTNLEMKRDFPESIVRDYAARRVAEGDDLVVLGHFHIERALTIDGAKPGRVFVLPEWKGSRRHLRVDASGRAAFEDS
ncbi:MAG TPA: metallophosphoesterase [Candidatus Polarisedimenticolaceae bacterium]|nr:metallophosphoesterase [Candidatus Polarisedimenticolaceae bacterium]